MMNHNSNEISISPKHLQEGSVFYRHGSDNSAYLCSTTPVALGNGFFRLYAKKYDASKKCWEDDLIALDLYKDDIYVTSLSQTGWGEM